MFCFEVAIFITDQPIVVAKGARAGAGAGVTAKEAIEGVVGTLVSSCHVQA